MENGTSNSKLLLPVLLVTGYLSSERFRNVVNGIIGVAEALSEEILKTMINNACTKENLEVVLSNAIGSAIH